MSAGGLHWAAVFSPLVALASGIAAYKYVPLPVVAPIFPATLVSLSMIGAAVLVRLARPAPITAPAAFNEEDLDLFFRTLRALSLRLFAIFVMVIAGIATLLAAIWCAESAKATQNWEWLFISQYVVGVLVGLLVWITIKLFEMAYGDIGFLALQREILGRAVKRDRVREAERKATSPIETSRQAPYGRALPPTAPRDPAG